MGFLIFAYRKLSLKRKINDLNFKLMTLQQKENSLLDKVGTMQQAMSMAQSIMTATSSSQMAGIQQKVMSEYYENGHLIAGKDAGMATNAFAMATNEAMMKNSLFTGAFEAQNKAQMTSLNTQGNQISQQKLTIESQLKQLNGEYDGVEKAEDDAAKKEAPKFGLG